ncbi:MAG: DUF1801 domain-containing protein [Bacteroidota bacterium]|jgi:uncharacterized protein YdhG (YjbR/CyaY superfamily)|nr:DUF1801 domain-containing protein [Bacteroidota bacterium]MCE2958464.1 DUF1801 domain-containing protein [Flammeovirgaceae bacterium]MCZ8069760.1 DUF1801 domain-containing protein [Cytophagales bacterium]
MQSKVKTVAEYLDHLPEDRKKVITQLRNTFKKNLPKGFEEQMSYGMIGYVVPHKLYPAGYHATPKLPLPFVNIASQKNHIAVYHMGMQGDLREWFEKEWKKHSEKKLDMGGSCIRFKKAEDVPLKLFTELAKKMTPKDWIEKYESYLKNRK